MQSRTFAASPPSPVIVWFRNDLRLADHPALTAAVETGQPLLLVYVFDETTPKLRRIGGASRWWLAHSLRALSADIVKRGSTLHILSGAAADVIPRLAAASGATAVFWSHRYAAEEVAADARVAHLLADAGIDVHTFNGNLGREPGEIKPQTGGWYRVYSAFWKTSQAARPLDAPLPAPQRLNDAAFKPDGLTIDDLGLLPTKPDWSGSLAAAWEVGEAAALHKLKQFGARKIEAYEIDRDRPSVEGSSRLSPHLRFGEISPRQVVAAVKAMPKATKFLQEITWRDFAYDILAHVPDLAENAFDPKFRAFPWAKPSSAALGAWQRGMTGYPIVDAGMRQLWQTGWMHNRVRMITASFLVKHMLCDWRLGEQWFWDTLCDADPANNGVNWQWVAGTGPDAAPFFRIFNPIVQGQKFDPEGVYVKRYVPELAPLPVRWIHTPWDAPPADLKACGIVLGTTYPKPVVDHASARQAALDAFASLRKDDR